MLGLRRSRGSVLAVVAVAAGLMAFTLYMKRIHTCPTQVVAAAAARPATDPEIKVKSPCAPSHDDNGRFRQAHVTLPDRRRPRHCRRVEATLSQSGLFALWQRSRTLLARLGSRPSLSHMVQRPPFSATRRCTRPSCARDLHLYTGPAISRGQALLCVGFREERSFFWQLKSSTTPTPRLRIHCPGTRRNRCAGVHGGFGPRHPRSV